MMDLVCTLQCTVDLAHQCGNTVAWVQALVGIHLSGIIGIRGDLPSADVDRLESRSYLLDRLIAGQCAKRGHKRFSLQHFPKRFCSVARESAFDLQASAQAFHVLPRIWTGNSIPSIRRPIGNGLHFSIAAHVRSSYAIAPSAFLPQSLPRSD